MRPEEADAAYLWHMLWAARRVQEVMAGADLEQYRSNWQKQAAVERGLEIVGEAARRVSDDFKKAHPEIPWSQIIGQRNIIAHMYYDLRQQDVWESATEGVRELITILEELVPPPPPDP